jgi:hypothetical protein
MARVVALRRSAEQHNALDLLIGHCTTQMRVCDDEDKAGEVGVATMTNMGTPASSSR